MGLVKVIIPEATTNLVQNPSFEANDTGYTAQASCTQNRITTQSKWGYASLELAMSGAANRSTRLTVTRTAGQPLTVSGWAKSASGTCQVNFAVFDSAFINWATGTVTDITTAWSEITALTVAGATMDAWTGGGTTLYVYIANDSDTGVDRTFYVDGIQIEEKLYATTHCDGDQEGCKWNGAAHASTSTRSAQYRGGGRPLDLESTYDVHLNTAMGLGMPPLQHNVTEYAVLPGNHYQSTKVQARPFTLVFDAWGDSLAEVHATKKGLLDALKPDLVWPRQPVRLRYGGAGTEVDIDALYEGGLEGQTLRNWERIPIRFLANDPMFYELGESAKELNTVRVVSDADYAVKKIDGVWSNISTALNGSVRAIAVGPDGTIYLGGEFTNVGDANGDYIIAVAPDGTISSLGTGLNNWCYALTIGPDGALYAAGAFTLAGGVANTAYIAKWDGAVWTPLGTGANGTVRAIAFGQDGTLYAGGQFALMGGVANTVGIAKWDGTVWTPLSVGITGGNQDVFALAVGLDGSLFVGGDFINQGDANGDYITRWDGTAWNSLGTGMSSYVLALAIGPDGSLYAGGNFLLAGGVTNTVYIAKWNGVGWTPLSTGMNSDVYSLAVLKNIVYAGGAFNTAGGLVLLEHIATWNGSTWSGLDVDLPSTPVVYSINVEGTDIYLGYATSGDANASNTTTLTNNGSATAYPKFIFQRSGGSSATVEWLRNETTGQSIYLNYALLNGESLTIDLTPGAKTARSDFFGNINRAILRGSDFATFGLLPGDNLISCLVAEVGGPTVTAYSVWRDSHWSVDGAA